MVNTVRVNANHWCDFHHLTGFDGISSKLFKKLAPTIIKPLMLLVTQVFNTGIFPDKLKVAKVIPVFKKGIPTIINNYRSISLLPVVSKVMEKILANQLSSHFESKKLFVNNQYGFRDGHSTEYTALELVDRIIIFFTIMRYQIVYSLICRKLSTP